MANGTYVGLYHRHGELEYTAQLFANGTRIVDISDVHDNISQANLETIQVMIKIPKSVSS